ncbi:amidohydrolase family protein [Sphingomonas bacterium]|uniref:amidohydrolase family protein n=1 Tax=Sphingomonas bacterium TaxID=1895847 RepID=UPI0015756182|nr:amidohydrolase family protein [Sphingomonas bacterium]
MTKLPTLFAGLLATTAVAQTPVADLARPPSDAQHFVIESTGGKHGDAYVWTAADGTKMARESMNLRGQVWEDDVSLTSGANGIPTAMTIRGIAPTGDAAETFRTADGTATWKSPIDGGSATFAGKAFYTAQGALFSPNLWFVEALIAAPEHRLALLPGGTAQARKLDSLTVGTGATARTVDLWVLTGIGNTPFPIWATPDGKAFAATFGLGFLPAAYADEQVKLEKAQTDALAKEAPKIAHSLTKVPAGAVAFTHVKTFDADALTFRTDQTVVVDHGTIVAVGPAAAIKVPAGAQVIAGAGMTLVPGLWDCHMHVGDDYTGPQELSLGVTSVRDPGNDDLKTIDRRTRAAAGDLLFPHVYPSLLIDGKGKLTAQVANVASSQAEAIALVDRAKTNAFTGVKFYGTFDAAWLPAAIAEAHKQGLHVHGHIPHGIRTSEAVADGYDEVTHINWIAMEGMPASVLPTDNGIGRFEAPGRYMKDTDIGPASPIGKLVATMAAKHIYSDPTMVAFEGLYYPDNGELSPAYAPFVGTLPPAVERGFRTGGFQVPPDLTRADYRRSWAKMVELLGAMHKAGVPIVAGTDGSGIEIVRELEIYQTADFSPAEALAAATIVPARLVGQEAHTGSIAVGKTADLALIAGDPEAHLGDLRHTRVVMLDGKLLDPDALRTAAGFGGRPKFAD